MHKEEVHFNGVTDVLDLDFEAVGSNVPFFFLSFLYPSQ